MGSDCVEAINAISGERCSPHPHNFTDRLIRPGDQAFFDIIHSYMGYRTCYYRTFSVGRATAAAARCVQAGARVDGPRDRSAEARRVVRRSSRRRFPTAQEIGFASEMDAFGLNFCHGLGLGLHERPLISRLNSLKEPIELKAGMVFAVETYCPASDGVSAARIEEEVILTPQRAEGDLAVPGAGAADRQPVSGGDDERRRARSSAGSASAAWATRWPSALAKAGADLTVWNRTRAKAEPLAHVRREARARTDRSRRLRHRVRDGVHLGRRARGDQRAARPAVGRTRAEDGRRVLVDLARGLGRVARVADVGAACRCWPRRCRAMPR